MNTSQIFLLCLCGAFFLIVVLIATIGDHYSLKGIPNKPVGNGQHGTARFATKGEVARTYKQIPYAFFVRDKYRAPVDWRKIIRYIASPMYTNIYTKTIAPDIITPMFRFIVRLKNNTTSPRVIDIAIAVPNEKTNASNGV